LGGREEDLHRGLFKGWESWLLEWSLKGALGIQSVDVGCSLFGFGVLVGVLVLYNGFMLSSVEGGDALFLLLDLLCRDLGKMNGCLVGCFTRNHRESLSPVAHLKSL